MSIYPNYLIHYHKYFLNNLEYAYNIDVIDAQTLLDSDEFSLQEKRRIIGVLSPKVMAGSQVLADKIIEVLLASNDILIGQDALNGVLTIAENEIPEAKVKLCHIH